MADPEIQYSEQREINRQGSTIELIASEHYVSEAVLQAAGTPLTNMYAEGYPGKRYYGGCEFVDEVETLAIERAQALFGAEHANVQPHSGAQANLAAYFALLDPGDVAMGMELSHGGHLTHGQVTRAGGVEGLGGREGVLLVGGAPRKGEEGETAEGEAGIEAGAETAQPEVITEKKAEDAGDAQG